MKGVNAVHISELPTSPNDLVMVAAAVIGGERGYLLRTELHDSPG
jgi:hypothetical protein